MIIPQAKTNIIIITRINDYSKLENLFFAMEMPRIIEEAIPDDVPALVLISEDGIYIRTIGPEDKIKTMQLYNRMVEKILAERDRIETAYNIKIDLAYILDKITFE